MKISYVTMQFPAPSETFASIDIENLRKKGHNVSVHSMLHKNRNFEKLILERNHHGLLVTHFSLLEFIKFFIFVSRHPLIALSLLRWVLTCCIKSPKHLIKSLVLFPSAISIFSSVLTIKPDVVHLFWGHYPTLVGYLVKKHMPNTVVSMFLGAYDLVSVYPGSSRLAVCADVVLTHSEANLSMMSEMGVDVGKVNVVVRGTKLDFSFEGAANKFEELSDPLFLTAGRLIKEKGVDDVLRIFHGILKIYPSAILNIAGDGIFRPCLEKMVSDFGLQKHVFFLGHVEQVELINVMSKTHFFLFMSRDPTERLPNVVKEAMYQECAVIATNTHGIDELIEHGVDGFIVDMGDWESGLASVCRCIENRAIACSVAASAKQKIIKRFDVNVSMNTYIDIWQAAKAERPLYQDSCYTGNSHVVKCDRSDFS